MKLACGRCWDRNCNCTPEQLEQHEKDRIKFLKNNPPKPLEYSKTEPKVTLGDIIILKNNAQYLVREIVDGIPFVSAVDWQVPGERFGNGKCSLLEEGENYKVLQLNMYVKEPESNELTQEEKQGILSLINYVIHKRVNDKASSLSYTELVNLKNKLYENN